MIANHRNAKGKKGVTVRAPKKFSLDEEDIFFFSCSSLSLLFFVSQGTNKRNELSPVSFGITHPFREKQTTTTATLTAGGLASMAPNNAEKTREEVVGAGDDGRAQRLTVLVVSPSSELRESSVAMLREAGHKVRVRGTGKAVPRAERRARGGMGDVGGRRSQDAFSLNSFPQKKKLAGTFRLDDVARAQGPGRQAAGELRLRPGDQRARPAHSVCAASTFGPEEEQEGDSGGGDFIFIVIESRCRRRRSPRRQCGCKVPTSRRRGLPRRDTSCRCATVPHPSNADRRGP